MIEPHDRPRDPCPACQGLGAVKQVGDYVPTDCDACDGTGTTSATRPAAHSTQVKPADSIKVARNLITRDLGRPVAPTADSATTTTRGQTVSARLSADEVAWLDAVARRLETATPGLTISRSEAIRILIAHARQTEAQVVSNEALVSGGTQPPTSKERP